MTTPFAVDTIRPATHAHTIWATAENRRLRGELARLREVVAAYEQRLDYMTRANARLESPRFRVRTEMQA